MRRARFIGLYLLLLVAGQAARAQQPGALLESLRDLDANGDMVIDKSEVPESAHAAFDRLLKRGDVDKDGRLQAEELRALLEKVRVLGPAGAGGGPAAARFKAMDKDGDGKVSKAEFQGPPALFDRLDADKDGQIDRQEAARLAAANAPTRERLKAMDRDGDGKVSRAEWTGPEPVFARLDTDKDGVITADEADKFLAASPGPASPPAPANAPGGPAARRFKQLDKDGDGKVSRDEFPGRPPLFDRLDANKDGALAPDELPAAAGAGRPARKKAQP